MDAFERRTLPGGVRVLVATKLERDGVLAAFSERTGGESAPPFDTLNLGTAEGDDATTVAANRDRLANALGLEGFALGEQVHGARVARVGPGRAIAGFDPSEDRIPGVDALVTGSHGVAMAVLVADCVPVVLVGPSRLAVVHVGWRGYVAGILGAALQAAGDPTPLRAAIGPAIGPCHYEVGEDVALAVASASEAGARTERRGGSLFLDLPGTVAGALRAAGVRRIDRSDLCTADHPDRFFSYRRDGRTGRQAAVAVRT